MSIIREAEQYIKSKKYKLIKGIAEKLDPLEEYIQREYGYVCRERQSY